MQLCFVTFVCMWSSASTGRVHSMAPGQSKSSMRRWCRSNLECDSPVNFRHLALASLISTTPCQSSRGSSSTTYLQHALVKSQERARSQIRPPNQTAAVLTTSTYIYIYIYIYRLNIRLKRTFSMCIVIPAVATVRSASGFTLYIYVI